jgi:hypothetical protein
MKSTTKVVPLRDEKRDDPRHRERKLRELCAWYEWSHPPNLAAATALQDAADAVKEGALSNEAADVLIAVWGPFVEFEARVGNLPPPPPEPEDVELGVLRVAIKDLGRWLKNAKTPEERRHLTKLLNGQIAVYERALKARDL